MLSGGIGKTAYSGFRVGDSLPPSVVPRLMRLGLWESFLQTGPSATYGVQSAWGTSELVSSVFLGNPFLKGWHLDRSRFDSMLSSAAADAGARIFRKAAVRSVERDPHGRCRPDARRNDVDGSRRADCECVHSFDGLRIVRESEM
jgi:flavin-dependent dehydrogenase